jgi:hypothetical protein
MSESNVATTPREGNVVLGILKKRWRAWLRAIHRDVGYLAVGLTVIYALSGLAINHITDWNPNFHTYEKTRTIAPIDPALDDDAATALALEELGITTKPRSVYRAGDEIHLEFDGRKITVIGDQVTDQGQQSRFFFRAANWLHYNRGKKAWTYIADGYACLLLYLAISGMFMLKGRLGLRWRGLILVGLGAGVPITYVAWSGGPEAANGRAAASKPAVEAAETPDVDETPTPAPAPDPGKDDDSEFERMAPRTP